jgi:hypothetical protein
MSKFSDQIFATSARLVRDQQSQLSEDELMQRARARAADPKIFDTNPPIFFSIEASNNNLDAYYTRMAISSLRNYAQAAEAGVSFQDSHRTNTLGLGASLSGRIIEESGKDLVRVLADIFTLPGLPDMESFIFRYRAGIAKDTSIGFYGGDFICSICGLDLWDWDCWHIPGLGYSREERDGKGEVISDDEEIAFAWVEDARLAEISAVYEGATPGCGILKASRFVEAGRITPQLAARFASAYRGLTIPGYQRSWPGFSEKGDSPMNEKPKDQRTPEPVTAPALAPGQSAPPEQREPRPQPVPAAQTGGVTETTVERSIVENALRDAGVTATDLSAGLAELVRLAGDGKRYRTDLVESALTEGVRVFGNDFDKATYRAMFEASSIDQVKRVLGDWSKQSASLLPAGRQTDDEAKTPEEVETTKPVRAVKDDPRLLIVPKSVFGG